MYAFIRRYRMGAGSIDDLMHKVDGQFAGQISAGDSRAGAAPVAVPEGIVSYHAIDTGNGTIATVTLFDSEERFKLAQAAAGRIREALAEFEVEELDTQVGPVMVSRAGEAVLAPVHHARHGADPASE